MTVPKDAPDAGIKTMILGLIQSHRGKQALAADAFQTAEELLPEDAACSFYLGKSLLAIGQTEKAAAAMQRAIKRKPARVEALPMFTELGRIYGRAGQGEKALDVWNQLEALFPGDARVGGQIARTLAEEGKTEDALERFQQLAKTARKDEDKIAFAVQAAEMQRRLGQNDQATASFESILARLRPGSWLHSDVRNRIEEGFLSSGDYDGLAEYYRGKLAESQDNLSLNVRLGRILVSAGRLDDAETTLKEATERAPDDASVRLALIDVLIKKAEMDAAAQQFEQLVAKDPENPDYLLRWGQVVLENESMPLDQRRETAAKIWQRLADARQEDAVTLSQIADRMRSIDRKEDAIALYRQSIKVDPTSPQYREYLGQYLHQLDRQEEAIEAWKSIADGDRKNRDSLVRLAEVFGTFKENERSLQAWREASALDLTFAQELRFATKLRDAKLFDEALERLDAAQAIAETPEENEQLLRDRVATYSNAGTLAEQIEKLKASDPNVGTLRELALMHSAAGQLAEAAKAIQQAMTLAEDDASVLLVAADIAERQSRFLDAATTYQRLAELDQRFRGSYLERVADLRMRLGQVDQALEVCESIIDANPASPDSYQFAARLAFRAGRIDEGITALNRAITVAPRDNTARKLLASQFAGQYRTDEAIELYWQAMRYAKEPDDRIALVRLLAPLYDRKTDMDTLLSRIEENERQNGNPRTTGLMMAAAHESVQDFGSARQAVDKLLASQPRDVSLLESMVRLCDASDEVVLAAEFQQRIVDLADTPEHRFRLVQLQLEGELIDIQTALSERISLASDPSRLGNMIRSSVRRMDLKTAQAICEEAIRRDESLWDVKLMLGFLLLFDTQDNGEESAAVHERIHQLAESVRQLGLPLDSLPPTAPKRTSSGSTSRTNRNYVGPRYWSRSGYELARSYQLGRYGSGNYGSYQRSVPTSNSYGHGRVLGGALLMISEIQRFDGDPKALQANLLAMADKLVPIPDPQTVNDANRIHELRALQSYVKSYFTQSPKPLSGEEKAAVEERTRQLDWRLAELDPVDGTSTLISRLMRRVTKDLERANAAKEGETEEPVEPLTSEQLDLLVRLYDQAKAKSEADGASFSTGLMSYQTILSRELVRAGEPERAKAFELQTPQDGASLQELVNSAAFLLRLQRSDEADALVDRMLVAIREDESGKTTSSSSISGTMGVIRNVSTLGPKFIERHRMQLIDAVLALAAKSQQASSRRRSSLSDGTLRAYVRSASGGYYGASVKGPLSSNLLHQSAVYELGALINTDEGASRSREFVVPDVVIDHLDQPLEDAPRYEQKMRSVLAAFAHWWSKRPEDCYSRLIQLCERYPDDVDLQIERARLASELNQPVVALELLDTFDPLDSRMLVRKEMAAMNLAARVGNADRAKKAAERLFGMRMDTTTQIALADQMTRLGLDSMASAVLRRLRGGRMQNESTTLEIAQSFARNDDKASAAEVAYSLLRRLNSGRGSSSNSSYYRDRAVSILKSAGRLDGLIQNAERKLEASPKSNRMRTELAELYAAAGRKEESQKLWSKIAKDKPNDPRQLLTRAKSLAQAEKPKEAALLYLDAFKKDPNLFSNNYYEMTRAVQSAKIEDEMFKRLTAFRASSIPYYRVDELLRIGGSGDFSQAKRDFLLHMLKGSEAVTHVFTYLRGVPESEMMKITEARTAAMNALCSRDAFLPTSSIWNVVSYGSGGTANGPLKTLLSLTKNKGPRERYAKRLTQVVEFKDLSATAKLMRAFFQIVHGSESDTQVTEAIDQIAKMVDRDEDQDASKEHRFCGKLLWQVGQELEKRNLADERPEVLIAIYREALSDPSNNRSQMEIQYTVGARLVGVLARNDQHAAARRYLLDALGKVDYADSYSGSPGYADYREIREIRSIAKMLDESQCQIDGLVVLNRLLADRAKIERAKRWGNRNSLQEIQEVVSNLQDDVTDEAAIRYLEFVGDDASEATEDLAIDLWELPIESLSQMDAKSGLLIAIEKAGETEAGRTALLAFQDTLRASAKERSKDWSLPAAQLLVASYAGVDPDEAGVDPDVHVKEQLFARLPEVEELKQATDTVRAQAYRSLADLFPVALSATQCENAELQTTGELLLEYLSTVATTIGEPNLSFAIANALGKEDAQEALLASMESKLHPGASLSSSQIQSCTQIAKSAAKAGKLVVASRAMKLAFGAGPPLREMGSSAGGDAFAISRSSSRASRDRESDAVAGPTSDLLEIAALFSTATGVSFTNANGEMDATGKRTDVPSVSIETWQQLASAFSAVVMPPRQGVALYAYPRQLVSQTNYDNFQASHSFEPTSIALGLGVASAKAGQFDNEFAKAKERLTQSSGKASAAAALFEMALGAGHGAAMEDALSKFESAMDSVLPPLDQEILVGQAPGTISQQMQEDSSTKSKQLELVLRVAWPLLSDRVHVGVVEGEPRKVDKAMTARGIALLTRAQHLINSDGYTSRRHTGVTRMISDRMMAHAEKVGDDAEFDRLLRKQMLGIERVQASYNYSDPKDMQRNVYHAKEQLLLKWALKNVRGSFAVRDLALSAQKDFGHPNSKIMFCAAAAKLEPEARYNYLKSVVLGDPDRDVGTGDELSALATDEHGGASGEGIVRWGTLVAMLEPPKLVRSQTPSLDALQALPVCTESVPVVDMVLMLVDVAAELGRSDALVKQLDDRKRSDHGPAAILSALVRLSGSDLSDEDRESIVTTLQAVSEHVKATRPAKNDDAHTFPELAFYLAARISRRLPDAPTETLKTLFADLLGHARKSQNDPMTSLVNRVMSEAGLGPAAGATFGSPLEHFVAVSIPKRYAPRVKALGPRFTFSDEGALTSSGGDDLSLLMLKYPLEGEFEFSLRAGGGSWGEASPAYGGLLYPAVRWNRAARIKGLGREGYAEFPVSSIQKGTKNTKSLHVSPTETRALCNDQVYLTDLNASSFPWVGIGHFFHANTLTDNIALKGDVKIPSEVNLIHPTLRGWANLSYGSTPDPLLPIGPKQDKEKITKQRDAAKRKPAPGTWFVTADDELTYKPAVTNRSGPYRGGPSTMPGCLQYMRPLLDGERVTSSVWWEWGVAEVHPSIGNTVIRLAKEGYSPVWNAPFADMSRIDLEQTFETISSVSPGRNETASLVPAENHINDKAWNEITLSREADTINVLINGHSILTFGISGDLHPGIMPGREVSGRIRSLKLTGDWPEQLPANLLERAKRSRQP
ncbi:MAG: tetratricopeptide repeat protein [Planctomycetota bacterium]